VTGPACPECGADQAEGDFIHFDGCPLSEDIDQAAEADWAWFDEHPGVDAYRRVITADEIAEFRLAGHDAQAGDWVEVVQIAPGLRLRWCLRRGQ
jgi:hypothetical protein